jgi:hypothetical protein
VHEAELRVLGLGLVVMVLATAVVSQCGTWDSEHEGHDPHGCQQASSHMALLLE